MLIISLSFVGCSSLGDTQPPTATTTTTVVATVNNVISVDATSKTNQYIYY